jgi:hypothetical protein
VINVINLVNVMNVLNPPIRQCANPSIRQSIPRALSRSL